IGVALRAVVAPAPIANQLLQSCQLHSLRLIGNGFPVRPPRSSDPLAKVIEGRLRYLGFEGPYRTVFALSVTWAGKEQKTKGQCGYRFVERHGSFTASGNCSCQE